MCYEKTGVTVGGKGSVSFQKHDNISFYPFCDHHLSITGGGQCIGKRARAPQNFPLISVRLLRDFCQQCVDNRDRQLRVLREQSCGNAFGDFGRFHAWKCNTLKATGEGFA